MCPSAGARESRCGILRIASSISRCADRSGRGGHTHEFRTDGGGTVIADVVQFDVHCRPLVPGPVRDWLCSDLRNIFEYRRRAAERVFGEERRA